MHRIKHLLHYIFVSATIMAAQLPLRAGAVDPVRDDSVSVIDYAQLSRQFVYDADTSLQVNESEVRAGLLYDAVNKKIIWQKNMGSAYPIASLTKMMVALLTVEDVKAGKFSWEDNVHWVRETITGRRHKRKKVYTSVNYTLRDVFKAAMIASNNECAEQMARYISCGDLKASIDRMNSRAHELGMTDTYYGNPTGLPAAHSSMDNSSSPTDQLLLTLELLKYDEVLEIAGMGYASIDNGRSTSVIRNHNRLTIDYSGVVDGLKTGYTRRAGFCLVATVNKCEHRLVSIVFGCRGPQIRNEVVRDMFSDYYSAIALDRLGGEHGPVPVLAPVANLNVESVSGEYATVVEKVRKTHLVKRGETLSQIASRYNCTVSQLRAWNKRALRQKYPISGQRLAIYTTVCHKVFIKKPANGTEEEDDKPILSEDEKDVLSQAVPDDFQNQKAAETAAKVNTNEAVNTTPSVPAKIDSRFVYHTVAPGDTLFSIARKYEGATVEQLKSINNISNIHGLKPGMKIKIPVQG